MTEKQKIAGLLFGLALIVSFGFGWKWFLNFNTCNQDGHKITQLIENQDNLLYTYGFFSEKILTENKQDTFKTLIDIKEPLIRANVEHFKKTCRSNLRKRELTFFLKNYETYLFTKQTLFNESQRVGFKWIRDNAPINPDSYNLN